MMQGNQYTSTEIAPLQANIEMRPTIEGLGAQAPLINPQCVAATCGAFAMLGLAAGAASSALRQGAVPAQAPGLDATVNLEEEEEDEEGDKPLQGKTIVIVSTSASAIGDHPTGVWLEEIATPYYIFKKAGAKVVVASTKGGAIPVDAASMAKGFLTDNAKKFLTDPSGALFHSTALEDVDLDDADALYFPGGHGAVVDFKDNDKVTDAIETVYNGGKIVAFDCHGPVALAKAKNEDGESIVKGKKVTGFSDAEEKAVKMNKLVPNTPEKMLKALGGVYSKGAPWTAHAVADGNLITGQNPQSSEKTAQLVVDALS